MAAHHSLAATPHTVINAVDAISFSSSMYRLVKVKQKPSETRMTVSVPKQDPNTKGLKERYLLEHCPNK